MSVNFIVIFKIYIFQILFNYRLSVLYSYCILQQKVYPKNSERREVRT